MRDSLSIFFPLRVADRKSVSIGYAIHTKLHVAPRITPIPMEKED